MEVRSPDIHGGEEVRHAIAEHIAQQLESGKAPADMRANFRNEIQRIGDELFPQAANHQELEAEIAEVLDEVLTEHGV